MPTAQDSWRKIYKTNADRSLYNQNKYGKRIKQLGTMSENEDFVGWLMSSRNQVRSVLSDLGYNDFETGRSSSMNLNRTMTLILERLQSSNWVSDAIRADAKMYVLLYITWLKADIFEIEDNMDLPF